MAGSSLLHDEAGHSGALRATPETGFAALVKKDQQGDSLITFQVDGVHCAACIQKIESRLSREPDVLSARLNFSTQRLSVLWNGAASRANDFAQAVTALGYGVRPYDIETVKEDSKEEERFLLTCLGFSGFAAGNMMTLSVVLWTTKASVLGMATEDFMHWVAAAIALPTVVIAGRPFFRSAFKALFAGHTNMDVPISLGIILASVMSVFETLRHGAHVYFDSAVMLIFFLLIGRYLDCRTRRSARSAATDLMSMMAGFATVVNADGSTLRLPIRDLREDMMVRIAAGEKFSADGEIRDGQTEIDTSLVTGETMPRHASPGSMVYAGTINLSAPVTVAVAKAAEDSLLSDIVRLMEKAGQGQARYVRLADRAAKLYTPVVHALALMTFLFWTLIMHAAWQDALMISVTILIITCPCALGLAVPVVQVLATGQLMRAGILVKAGDALERLSAITRVIFDKTGTLTLGRPRLQNRDQISPDHLAISIALAGHSHHPLCQALAAVDHALPIPALNAIRERQGQGMEAEWNGQTIRLGSRKWINPAEAGDDNFMELWLSVPGQSLIPFYFDDSLRDDAQSVVSSFERENVHVTLLSGDRIPVVRNVAAAAGIADYAGEKNPTEKYDALEWFKESGDRVLMVGDGLNDAPVLAGADVSMSPSTAIDMAQNAADIIFMGDRLGPVYTAWRTASFSQKLVRQNLWLAVLYNVIAVPLAVAGFVTPLIASIAMSSSSLIVIANSFRLRSIK